MAKSTKTRASKQAYVSPMQGVLPCFEMPFSGKLSPDNRWVVLANQLPWDAMVSSYLKQMNNSKTGASGINPRVALGCLIIKHICDLSDRETIQQVRENVYMQYFIGYSSFSESAPFDPSLFVDLRKRIDMKQVNIINEQIIKFIRENDILLEKLSGSTVEARRESNEKHKVPVSSTPSSEQVETGIDTAQPASESNVPSDLEEKQTVCKATSESDASNKQDNAVSQDVSGKASLMGASVNRGKMIIDATVCPQDIAYPTDLSLLNDAREKSEELIDFLYQQELHGKKPRTYRHKARKLYLSEAQKKTSSARAIRKANGKQLGFLKRNILSIHRLLDEYKSIPFTRIQYKYFLVIQTLFDQQYHMHQKRLRSIEHRIVSIHQPHVRPIVRGKRNAKVEFGAKIQVCLMNGFVFLDDLEWEAFNEGCRLMASVEKYKERFGYYPAEVLADKIYCSRENRKLLKNLNIMLRAKPLGRPSSCQAVEDHVRPGERNPIEGVFGQAKTAYGMNRIKARLSQTSGSWIASIIMVINLVKLAGLVYRTLNLTWQMFSEWMLIVFNNGKNRRKTTANYSYSHLYHKIFFKNRFFAKNAIFYAVHGCDISV